MGCDITHGYFMYADDNNCGCKTTSECSIVAYSTVNIYQAKPTTTSPSSAPTPEPTTASPSPAPTPEPTTASPSPAPTPEPTTASPSPAPTPYPTTEYSVTKWQTYIGHCTDVNGNQYDALRPNDGTDSSLTAVGKVCLSLSKCMGINQIINTSDIYLRMEENFANFPPGWTLQWTDGNGIGSVRGADGQKVNICYAKPGNFSIGIIGNRKDYGLEHSNTYF